MPNIARTEHDKAATKRRYVNKPILVWSWLALPVDACIDAQLSAIARRPSLVQIEQDCHHALVIGAVIAVLVAMILGTGSVRRGHDVWMRSQLRRLGTRRLDGCGEA